jgi:nucleoside-diphosphate-sugar epimerase
MPEGLRRILVAGGSGFIGRHLVRRLVASGHDVLTVDNHVTSIAPEPETTEQIIEADVAELDLDLVPEVDAVVHLASIAAPALFLTHAEAIISANVDGTRRLLEVAARDGARLIYASSSEVYGSGGGRGSDVGMTEDHVAHHELLSEKSPYSTAKLVGEELVRSAWAQGVDACAVRLFNVYGRGMDRTLSGGGRVISAFIWALEQGEPLPIGGDGEQVRSFTWVDDCVDGLEGLLNTPNRLPPVLNLGSDQFVSINELANLMAEVWGQVPTTRPLDRRTGDADWRRPDCRALRELTGWAAETSLRKGLGTMQRLSVPSVPDKPGT